MGAGKKLGGWSMVVMSVFILGLVLQTEGRSCGDSQCYWRCTKSRSKGACAVNCDCEPIDSAERSHFRNSGDPNGVELCSSGCRSSICGIINTVDGSEEVKRAAVDVALKPAPFSAATAALGLGLRPSSFEQILQNLGLQNPKRKELD